MVYQTLVKVASISISSERPAILEVHGIVKWEERAYPRRWKSPLFIASSTKYACSIGQMRYCFGLGKFGFIKSVDKGRTRYTRSILTESINASHSINLFTNSSHHISTIGKAPPHPHKSLQHPQFHYSLWRRADARNVNFPNRSWW